MSGDKARGLSPPEPGQELSPLLHEVQEGSGYRGIYGLIWRRARYYDPFTAKCQRCGWEWEVRSRGRVLKMPLRCARARMGTLTGILSLVVVAYLNGGEITINLQRSEVKPQ